MDRLAAWQPRFLSVLRTVSALIFLLQGTQKLLGMPPTERSVELLSLPWVAELSRLSVGLSCLLDTGRARLPFSHLER